MSNILQQFKDLANYNLFTPFFIIALSFIIISAALLIVNTKLKSKIIEIIYSSILATLVLCIIYFYRKIILATLDALVETIMTYLFFPTKAEIIFMIIISILIFIYVLKLYNEKRWFTVFNIVVNSVLLILNIVILVVLANTENIYYAYKNSLVLLIMEISTFSFYIYLIIFIIVRIKYRKKKENKKIKKTKDGLEILAFD